MEDLISRKATIEAIEKTDWYHINKDGVLVRGANSAEDLPLFIAEDVFEALRVVVPTKQRWIPVTERLPDSNKSVLVRCTNTTISGGYVTHIGSCDSGKFWFLRTQPGTASFPVREWQVTHWMPLPEPPKEG